VGGGDEQPFAAGSIQAAAGHRGQLLACLDLAEYRFDGLCPEFVVGPAAVVAHPPGRSRGGGQLGQVTFPGRVAGAVDEYDGVMMLVNHSCEPNVGVGGNVLLVSMRDIAAAEELTIDYALFLGDPGFAMACRCGTAACRAVVKGTDWMRAGLQERYRGWFSWWLQRKIAATRGAA